MLAFAAMLWSSIPSSAQLQVRNRTEVFAAGGEANLFVEVDGGSSVVGGTLQLPPRWTLGRVSLVHRGRELGASWSSEMAGRYHLDLAELGSGPNHLVLGLNIPTGKTSGTLTLAPEVLSAGERVAGSVLRYDLTGEPRLLNDAEKVGKFDASNLLALDADALSLHSGDRSFTLEFWIKTTSTDQVVMSSWDGDEESSYPAEVILSSDGTLLFFRGQPGRHMAMSSGLPVADGAWHHIAVSHDEIRGWSRLLIDAVPRDSLLGSDGLARSRDPNFCVGGRCDGASTAGRRFVGLLDNVRIWPMSRTNRQIGSAMVDHIPEVAGLVSLAFEDRPASKAVVGSDDIERQASDFLYFDPVADLTALNVGAAVEIRWRSNGRATQAFALERSADGDEFVEIARYDPERKVGDRYVHQDERPPSGVGYYRIRQVLVNGGNRYSPTVKLGLGDADVPDANAGGVLLANFPNPFSAVTTISFEVSEPQHVTVSVWDLSGQQIASLLDASLASGRHDVTFTPDDLPSGTYFARLQTETAVITRKIILAK